MSPLTLEIISKNKIVTEGMTAQVYDTVDHVFLAQETDLIVIMPATADIIGKVANGIADDIVSSICMAIPADKPKLICPAMNTEMYNQSILQENLAKLAHRNYKEIPPRVDILTSGKRGIGALAEAHVIINQIVSELNVSQADMMLATV
ncbi:flavoprotein [Brochothrix campestris]|uniref:Phosphopantothenoylcysteine decarboxylase n=1 Tax=Brochothrix campestris FSL F6-1037 TaxID=1265861 RepID=W7CZB5_9LIST|nr:flavoprotein [Brochothrix campestris]EUJ42115.1 phosphopantothenoylcysteine decarboxylase [Brochothrix campestris FSL F6-1037]